MEVLADKVLVDMVTAANLRVVKLEGIIREARSYFGANETAYIAKVLDSAFSGEELNG